VKDEKSSLRKQGSKG